MLDRYTVEAVGQNEIPMKSKLDEVSPTVDGISMVRTLI